MIFQKKKQKNPVFFLLAEKRTKKGEGKSSEMSFLDLPLVQRVNILYLCREFSNGAPIPNPCKRYNIIWKPFMTYVLGFTDVNKLFELVLILVGFYVLYAIQNVFDSTFYGLGKTQYMFFESVVTNSVYYGIAFILYAMGVWTPTLVGIALLFGIGNAFDSLVSLAVYAFMLKKEKINILNID